MGAPSRTFENRVPDEVFFLLFVGCCLGMALIGFGFGMAQRREVFGTVLFGLLLCSTIYIVLDLDRPRRGLIDVSQMPMLGLKEAVQSGCRAAPETKHWLQGPSTIKKLCCTVLLH